MKAHILLKSLTASTVLLGALSNAEASLVSVAGPNSSRGAAPAIILAPATLNNDVAFNLGQQGFDERQCVLLPSSLEVDDGIIAAGTLVSSHMIFMNQQNNTTGGTDHTGVEWTFDGLILGVMSDNNGNLEAASTPILGAPASGYGAPFNNRGLESNDSYSFLGNVLTFNSHITQPGDWIRVVTAAQCVPDATGLGTAALGFLSLLIATRRSRK